MILRTKRTKRTKNATTHVVTFFHPNAYLQKESWNWLLINTTQYTAILLLLLLFSRIIHNDWAKSSILWKWFVVERSSVLRRTKWIHSWRNLFSFSWGGENDFSSSCPKTKRPEHPKIIRTIQYATRSMFSSPTSQHFVVMVLSRTYACIAFHRFQQNVSN